MKYAVQSYSAISGQSKLLEFDAWLDAVAEAEEILQEPDIYEVHIIIMK